MANVTYVAGRGIPARGVAGSLRRAVTAVELGMADLRRELNESRRELRLRRSLRGFDRNRLQDLGLDRRAC